MSENTAIIVSPIAVTSLGDIIIYARNRRSIVGDFNHGRPVPAAIIAGWPGNKIHMELQCGMWLYEPKPREKRYDRKGGQDADH